MLTAARAVASTFDALRRREFDRDGVFGNPHSAHEPSRTSTEHIERARACVLEFLDADPERYAVCFTSNATSAIKLVAESFPFDTGGVLVLTADNHNSVNGVREYARRAGSRTVTVAVDDELRLDDAPGALARSAADGSAPRLFAFPTQSNFSGVQHPLALVEQAHALGYHVLLDAAAFVPSNRLSLRQCPADFVALSAYKLFGYPTGVGALVVRRDAARGLRRPWFAGGTVDFVSVQNDLHQLRALPEGFEDGTPDFLALAALPAGFALLNSVGIDAIHDHAMFLTGMLLERLAEIAHRNGASLVRLYGPADGRDRGGTVAFNVLARDGLPIPYAAVEARAHAARVALRGGCFCNPGAAERAFGVDPMRTADCLRATGGDGFTLERFAECLGPRTAVGALRASVGLATNVGDVTRCVDFIASFAA